MHAPMDLFQKFQETLQKVVYASQANSSAMDRASTMMQ